MKKVIGTNIKCLTTDPNGTFKQIAFARSAIISMSREMKEIASSTSGIYKEYRPLRIQWSASIDGLLSDEQAKLYSLFETGKALDISWQDGNQNTAINFFYRGKAYIKSLVLTGNIHEMATFSVELQGTGTLTCTDFPYDSEW